MEAETGNPRRGAHLRAMMTLAACQPKPLERQGTVIAIMRSPRMDKDRIVAVGLLTQHDLDVLGQGFTRSYNVRGIEGFEDLLAKLDRISATPLPDDDRRRR